MHIISCWLYINSSSPGQTHFLQQKGSTFDYISLKFVPKGPIDNSLASV